MEFEHMEIEKKDTLGILISILYRFGSMFINQELQKAGIGPGQHAYMLYIADNDGVSQDDIARHFKVDKATVARGLKKLELSGYIERSVNADDRRAYNLHVTPAGREILPHILKALLTWGEGLTRDIPPEGIAQAIELLKMMAQNAETLLRADKDAAAGEPRDFDSEYRET
jgi:DNA-binding MarR family transcriptional regulator